MEIIAKIWKWRSESRPVTRGREAPLEKFSLPLQKCVGHSLKILEIVWKIWALLGKLFAHPGVPSWLRACLKVRSVRSSKLLLECPRSLCLLLPSTQKRWIARNFWNPTGIFGKAAQSLVHPWVLILAGNLYGAKISVEYYLYLFPYMVHPTL